MLGSFLSGGAGVCALLYTLVVGSGDPGLTQLTRRLGPMLVGQGLCLAIVYVALGTAASRQHFGVL